MMCACGKRVEEERAVLGLGCCYECGKKTPRVKGVQITEESHAVDLVVGQVKPKRHGVNGLDPFWRR